MAEESSISYEMYIWEGGKNGEIRIKVTNSDSETTNFDGFIDRHAEERYSEGIRTVDEKLDTDEIVLKFYGQPFQRMIIELKEENVDIYEEQRNRLRGDELQFIATLPKQEFRRFIKEIKADIQETNRSFQ